MNIDDIIIAKSKIHGNGCFARCQLRPGDTVAMTGGLYLCSRPLGPMPFSYNHQYDFYPSSPFCYLNHASTANAEAVLDEEDGTMYLVIRRTIEQFSEITIDYGFNP